MVYAYNNVCLYRLLKQDPRSSDCQDDDWQDLLKNPGFEESGAEAPNAWTKFGAAAVLSSPLALSGDQSVQVDQTNSFYQSVAVTEQKLYTLSAAVKSQQPTQVHPKLQIVWLDAANQALDWSIAVLEAGPNTQQLASSVTAPPGAQAALIDLMTYTGSAIFDDVALRVRVEEVECP